MTVKSKTSVKNSKKPILVSHPPRQAKGSAPSSQRVVSQESRPLEARKISLLCLVLALLVAAVYSRATRNPFVNYDDQGYVVENEHVQRGVTVDTLRWALTSKEDDNWHPLTWVSHALDCQWFGLNPAGHHATSVVLHGLNAMMLFLLLVSATGAVGRSFVVAALFALHPMNVESVAWVAERKNVLSMFLFLLTLGAYGWYAKRPGVMRYLLVVVLFALGLAAKPMLVTLPFVLLLVDVWPLQRVVGLAPSRAVTVARASFGRLVAEKLPLLALSVCSSIITMIAQRGALADSRQFPFFRRLLSAIYAYASYVLTSFWPTRLAAFYPYKILDLSSPGFLLGLALLAGITIFVWRERRCLYLPVGWCWFLGTLIPVIGLVQVGQQARADRYAYLPLIGIFCMVVWGLQEVNRGGQIAKYGKGVAAVVALIACSWLTWKQVGVWHGSYELWSHAIQVTDDNGWAEDYVGSALLVSDYKASGRRYSEEALVHFRNAVRIYPQDAIAHLNIGAYLHERGQLQDAIQEYESVLDFTQDRHLRAKALIDLGAANQQLGNFTAARQYYSDALKVEPGNRAVFISMGRLALEQRIQELAAEATQHPSSRAYFDLAQLQQSAGHLAEARSSFQAALQYDPKSVEIQMALNQLDQNNSNKKAVGSQN